MFGETSARGATSGRLAAPCRQLLSRLTQAVLEHPFWLLHGLFALLLAPALMIDLGLASRYMNARISVYLEHVHALMNQEAENVNQDLGANLQRLDGLASVLAQSQDVLSALAPTNAPEAVNRLNHFLNIHTSTIGPDAIWIMDLQGHCIAASNHDEAASYVGLNFADLDYFRAASNGMRTHQFLVSRATKIPGQVFAAPVMQAHKVIGVIAVRLNLNHLRSLLGNARAFVTDAQGVIIIAQNPHMVFKTVDAATTSQLPDRIKQSLYGQTDLAPLQLTQIASQGGVKLWRIGNAATPTLLDRRPSSEQGLEVFTLGPLDELASMDADKNKVLAATATITVLLLWMYIATTVFLWRSRLGEKQLAEANSHLQQLNERLERQAHHDFLTGIANRWKFTQVLTEEIGRSQRYHSRLALAAIDLDYFKKVNDLHGHEGGDQALQHFARLVLGEIRTTDLFARIGGEEFGLILPETDLQEAVALLERIRLKIQQNPLAFKHQRIALTISIGVAEYLNAESQDRLMRRADEALYCAKQSGRNRLCIASSQEPGTTLEITPSAL